MIMMVVITMYFIMCFVSYGVILYREQYAIEYDFKSYQYIKISDKEIKDVMENMYILNKILSLVLCVWWPIVLVLIYKENKNIKEGLMFNKNNIYH